MAAHATTYLSPPIHRHPDKGQRAEPIVMSRYRHNSSGSSKINSRNASLFSSVSRAATAGTSSSASSSFTSKGSSVTHLLDHGYGATPQPPPPSSSVHGNRHRAPTMNMGSNSKRCSMPARYSSNDSQITSYYRVSAMCSQGTRGECPEVVVVD